jgi:hypothetical protein
MRHDARWRESWNVEPANKSGNRHERPSRQQRLDRDMAALRRQLDRMAPLIETSDRHEQLVAPLTCLADAIAGSVQAHARLSRRAEDDLTAAARRVFSVRDWSER